jgi:alpha-tubulin suppressor-like RCC1 family protein
MRPRNITHIAVGANVTAAIDTTQRLWTTGSVRLYGADTDTHRWTDSSLGDVISVDAGHNHMIAATEDGTLWATGDNKLGQFGDTSNTVNAAHRWVPEHGMNARHVAATANTTVMIDAYGHLYGTGNNNTGALGIPG